MTRQLLSICMIVKNEERDLPGCLRSVQDLANDIVVVDTGSTDRTVEIAAGHGARVFHFDWVDDFSLARNFSIEQALGEWILVLDADESIAARDHAAIHASLSREDIDAVAPTLRYYVQHTVSGWQPGPGGYAEGEPFAGFFDVGYRRLFRTRPWIRYVNRVHESVVSLDPAHPLTLARGDWVIHHYGKLRSAQLLRAKAETYRRLGEAKVLDNPLSAICHYELGLQYGELGRSEEAIACFAHAEELEPGFRDSRLQMAVCQSRARRYAGALASLRAAASTMTDRRADIAFEEGNVHSALKDHAAAEQAYRRALAVQPDFAPASVNLALLYQRYRSIHDALACVEAALALTPRNRALRMVGASLRHDSGDFEGCLSELNEIGMHDEAAVRLRTRVLVRLRRFEEASLCLASLQSATDPEAVSLRGVVALGLGNVGEGLKCLRRSVTSLIRRAVRVH